MFKVSFMVEDRKLAETLRPLASKAFNMEVVPVNVDAPPRKASASNGTAHDGKRDWSAFPLPKKGTEFNRDVLVGLIEQFGLSAASIYHVRSKLVELGRIKKVKDQQGLPGGDIYQVI